VTGIRRSGKSTLLEAFKHELIESGVAKRNIVFLNFEERENMYLTNWTALYDEIIKNIKSDKKYYVLLFRLDLALR
jgi:predicted AAA+ superfamily ATPase